MIYVVVTQGRGTAVFGGDHSAHQHCGIHGTGHGETGHGTTTETPLDILSGRYARGEIDRIEYLEKKRELEG
jgi:hypothetical protein